MNRLIICLLLVATVLPGVSLAQSSDVVVPIATDSRIKTFIYNENDVFSLMTHYGYQANIEFGPDEVVETLSVGDRVAFQIIPSGRRLFIRPMEESARTNMTVITNLRSYQFDLKSTGSPKSSKEELVYVARFFYPDEAADSVVPVHAYHPPRLAPTQQPAMRENEVPSRGIQQGQLGQNHRGQQEAGYNFLYSVAGPESMAPVRMYDDGHSTYLTFRNMQGFSPKLFEVDSDGMETPLQYRNVNGVLVIDKVMARLTIRNADQYACIYNDTLVPIETTMK